MKNEISQETINQLLEEGENVDSVLDANILKNLLNEIENKFTVNKNLRNKYKDNPDKFIESEADLHEEIKVLGRISAYPNLINDFIKFGGVEILMDLLSHENPDIIDDIVIILDEITDGDFLIDLDNPKDYLENFISLNLFDLLLNNLFKIKEDEDTKQVVTDILSVYENFIEVYPFSAKILGRSKFIPWLLEEIKGEFTENKLFASELLNSLAQSISDNQIIILKNDEINLFIKILCEYQKEGKISDPSREEFIHNIVNTLCCCLLIKDNQSIFKSIDGIKIILKFTYENNLFRHLAIKILDFSTQNNPKNCKELIENDGLKSIFSYFMGKGFKNKQNLKETSEEHCLSIISSLCKFSKGVPLDRLIYKFKENNYEKCSRLIELYLTYDKNAKTQKEEESTINESLFNLQQTCIIIAFLLSSSHVDIKDKLIKLFRTHIIKVENIKSVLQDMSNLLGDEFETTEEYFSSKSFLENLIKNI